LALLTAERIVVVDTETTGMSPAFGDALVEVATVVIENGVIGETWSSLVQPGRGIPAGAAAVHGITDRIVAEAPAPAVVAPELRRRIGADTIAFHNTPFDLPFVRALMLATGQPAVFNPVIDTLGLARAFANEGGNSLQTLRTRYALPAETAHRALGDALTTARLLIALAERWEREKAIRGLLELAAASQDAMRAAARNREPNPKTPDAANPTGVALALPLN